LNIVALKRMRAVKLFVFLCLAFDWPALAVVAPPYPGQGGNSDPSKLLETARQKREQMEKDMELEQLETEGASEEDPDYEWIEVEEGLVSLKTLVVGGICVGGAAAFCAARKFINKSSAPSKKLGAKSTAIKTPSKPFITSTVDQKPEPVGAEEAPAPAAEPVVATPEPEPEPEPEEEEVVEAVAVAAEPEPEPEPETSEPEAPVAEGKVEEPIAEDPVPEVEEKVEEVAEESEEKTEDEVAEPSIASISPGGATDPVESATKVEILEAEPAGELPETPFTSLFGDSLLTTTDNKDKLQKVHTASALAGKKVGVYFHAKKFDEMLLEKGGVALTPKIASIYEQAKAANLDFEMVYCGMDSEESDFADFFNEMPWLSVLQENVEVKHELVKQLQIEGFPSVVILNEQGEVINNKALASMLTDPEGFPWEPQTLTELLGTDFVDNMGNGYDADALENKVIGLYFSAHWCPPCREFTPKFAQIYEKLKAQGKEFEVVYVSSDKSEETYNEYLSEMPWLAIPYADQRKRSKLQVALGVGALPTLVIIDKDRTIITQNGRTELAADPEGAEFPWYPKPLKNMAVTAEGLGEGPAVMIFAEGASQEEQEKAIETMTPIAESNVAGGKPFVFFYSTQKTPVTSLLRKMCALEGEAQDGDKPVMVVLDLATKSYAVCDEDVTSDSIQNFLSSFESKELKMTEVDVSGFQE